MYRIVCESYANYIADFIPNHTDDYRYRLVKPLALMVDMNLYSEERAKCSLDYKKLVTFVYLLNQDLDSNPRFKSLLWSLESRGVIGHNYEVLSIDEFEDLRNTVLMFLKLAYWG